jgi:hypothetical protein
MITHLEDPSLQNITSDTSSLTNVFHKPYTSHPGSTSSWKQPLSKWAICILSIMHFCMRHYRKRSYI